MGQSRGLNGRGVFGVAHNGSDAKGVVGTSSGGTGVRGNGGTYGVYGSGAAGVYGTGIYGLYGVGEASTGPTYGVIGLTGGADNYGVWGYNTDSGGRAVQGTGGTYGVYGQGTFGVWGASSSSYAVVGVGTGSGHGVYGEAPTAGWAGVFFGKVYVGGALTKAGGGFQIDHPLQPNRRYLVHSFVEAPERLNVYSGTVTLNARGRATVQLPRYFGAANAAYRYQLTAIGAAAPNLHVSRRIERNRFSIAGGAPGLEVCWLVTGVRQDAWAKANPLRVEPLKDSQDRGRYLHPKLFGGRASQSIHQVAAPRARRSARRVPQIRPAG
jgi:hypothetical protein